MQLVFSSKQKPDLNHTVTQMLPMQQAQMNKQSNIKAGIKKQPYWLISAPPVPPKMKICSLETKNTEKNEGKTESGKCGKHST